MKSPKELAAQNQQTANAQAVESLRKNWEQQVEREFKGTNAVIVWDEINEKAVVDAVIAEFERNGWSVKLHMESRSGNRYAINQA